MADIMKCKNVTEFTAVMEYTGVNFIDILRAIFCQYFGAKKNSNPKHSFVFFGAKILYKNVGVKH